MDVGLCKHLKCGCGKKRPDDQNSSLMKKSYRVK